MDQAVLVLVIGMLTVFFVLGMVVLSGEVLIRIVNSFYQEETSKKVSSTSTKSIDKRKLAAILAAIEIVTDGKGTVQKIDQQKR